MVNCIKISSYEREMSEKIKNLRLKTKLDFLKIFVDISKSYNLASLDDAEYIQNHVFELLRASTHKHIHAA